jgi:hypothetical protein
MYNAWRLSYGSGSNVAAARRKAGLRQLYPLRLLIAARFGLPNTCTHAKTQSVKPDGQALSNCAAG